MCILFIYVGGEMNCKYKLILASNRDEHYNRPASVASRWLEDKSVIGGRDMEPGHEGGTWLAANTTRKRVGVLLNLPGVPFNKDALGRGAVVSDYILGEMPTREYLQRFIDIEYRPFNLVTLELNGNSCGVNFFSNFDKKYLTYNKGVLGFSNSLPDTPLKKVTAGCKRFEDVMKEYGDSYSKKDDMINELLNLLKWEELHLPDEVLTNRSSSNSKELAAVFVKLPEKEYGTRTHTIILIDMEDNMEFWEWTKIPEQTEWLSTYIKQV